MVNITKSGILTARVHLEGWGFDADHPEEHWIFPGPNLAEYLFLEAAMQAADREENEQLADQIRDLMDTVWSKLTAEQLAMLDSRVSAR